MPRKSSGRKTPMTKDAASRIQSSEAKQLIHLHQNVDSQVTIFELPLAHW